jgi:diguanylate cyclase (GGDEF)-like protein
MLAKFRKNIQLFLIAVSQLKWLRIITLNILIVLLVSFLIGIVSDQFSPRNYSKDHSILKLETLMWLAKSGFTEADINGFSSSDPGMIQIQKFPIDLNRLFSIPPGNRTNEFTLMTKFDLPADLINGSVSIMVPELGENWAIYLNGNRIEDEIYLKKDGSILIYRNVQRSIIILPTKFIQDKNNILVFRMIGDSPFTRFFSGDLPGFSMGTGLILSDSYEIIRMRDRLNATSYFLIGIYSFWGLFMFLFFRRRNEIYALLFSAFLLLFAGYTFFSSIFIFDSIQDTAIITRLMNCDIIICVPILGICFWNFLWPHKTMPGGLILMSSVCAVGIFLMLFLPFPWISTIFRIFVFLLVGMTLYIFAIIIRANVEQVRYARYLLFAGIIVVVIAFWSLFDVVYFRTGFDLISWTPFFLTFEYAFIFTERYWEMGVELVEKNIQLQANASQLEDTVAKRTEELTDAKSELEQQLSEINSLQTILHEQVMRDPLSGLYNRRFMVEILEKEFARANRKNYPITLIMMDIDHFKRINDTYSHIIGDQVLIALGKIFATCIRIDDYAVRYGGEEFLIIFPQTPYQNALSRANQIRELVKNVVIENSGVELKITISGGIAGFPDHGKTSQEVLSHADIALFRAKKLGRDRIEVYYEGEDYL